MALMSDPGLHVDDLEAVGDLARLIGQRLTPLYQLAPDVMPGAMPVHIATSVQERLRRGEGDAARTLTTFLWPTDGPPDGWWDTVVGRRCIDLGVEGPGGRQQPDH
jgi:hypothetical protein